MHPLTPDLTKLTPEELQNKYGDLQKRLSVAFRMGRPDQTAQLQMLMQDYYAEIQRRNAIALEELEKNSKNFKNIIDIQ